VATWRAISSVGRALLGLIEDHYPTAELVAPEFKLVHPFSFDKPQKEGFSLCLYHVGINGTLRMLPPRRDAAGGRYHPSLPLDLQLLLTPWAEDAERQMRLIGWVMRFFEDMPILPAAVLNSYAAEPDTFRPEEAVELVFDPLALADYLALWDKLKPRMQTSLTYGVRMLIIDSELEMTEARPAQTRDLRYGDLVPS
jgi:Pvc16 N-terminal domain